MCDSPQRGDKVTDCNKVLVVSKVYTKEGDEYFMGVSNLAFECSDFDKLKQYRSEDYVLLRDK